MKKNLTTRQIADYFRRSFTAVDGLWFMKVEEKLGFEGALDIDNEVWKVLPKIQVRELKSMLNAGEGLHALKRCLETDLTIKGYGFTMQGDEQSLEVTIHYCPWREIMVKSGREHLSSKIGETICLAEYSAWAKEFGAGIQFEHGESLCDGAKGCVLRFFAE